MNGAVSHRKGLLALSPLVVFFLIYLLSSLVAGDFYKVPVSAAFLVACIYGVAVIPGPMNDRIDLACEISAVPFKDLSNVQPGEPSSAIRERVIATRKIQTERFKDSKLVHCNAQMNDRVIHQYCVLDQQTLTILQTAMERMNLSARAYSRILKVARTIADLEGKENIEMHHVAEAVGYRSLDRGDWAER